MRGNVRSLLLLLLLAFVGLFFAAGQPACPDADAADPPAPQMMPQTAPQIPPQMAPQGSGPTDIYDIKPLAPFPGYPGYVKWLAGLAAAALLFLMAYLGYLYFKRKRAGSEAPPPLPPEETALKALAGIRDLMDSSGKDFYFRLSLVLREYIAQRFLINAPDMTTEELLPRLKKLGLGTELNLKTREFYDYSDPVKFADAIASRDKMQEHFKFARFFVKTTTPSVSEPVQASGEPKGNPVGNPDNQKEMIE